MAATVQPRRALGELLTTRELAEQWKLNPRTLDNWRSAGLGPPFVKVGGSVRYSRLAADDWLTATQERERGA